MTRHGATLRRRALAAVRDPWVLLSAGVGVGVAWALGIPPALDVATGAVMLASATGIGIFVGAGRDGGSLDDDDDAAPRLRSGTRQAQLVSALEGYLADLREMHRSRLPDAVKDSAIEALVAADGARRAARRVAVAIDGLDGAIERAKTVAANVGGSGAEVRASLQRMQARRGALLKKLDGAVGEVAEVYTKLLELSATVDTLDLSDGDGSVEAVNDSLDGLRTAFAELEADAASARRLT
jgi:hypothetical protein